jgi:hypothetical protein
MRNEIASCHGAPTMIQNVDPGAGAPSDLTPPTKSGCWLYSLLGVGAVVLLIGLLLPVTRTGMGGRAARRAQCSNNLKQIMLAMHTYADTYGAFPPAYTVDADGRPLHSWRTLLLPYLEGAVVYRKLDLSKPWDDPVNATLLDEFAAKNSPASLHCPSNHVSPGKTTYLAIVTPNSCLRPGEGRPLADLKDGQSNTVVIIEVPADKAVPWMAPLDADEALMLSIGPEPKSGSPHPSGFMAALCDGSARLLRYELSAEERRALITIDAGDKIKPFD